MSLDTLVTKIKDKLSYAAGLSAKVKFDFRDDGYIFVDSTGTSTNVTSGDNQNSPPDADLVITSTKDVFEGILNGTQDPNFAFMTGKLKVKGNMGLAMKINALLED